MNEDDNIFNFVPLDHLNLDGSPEVVKPIPPIAPTPTRSPTRTIGPCIIVGGGSSIAHGLPMGPMTHGWGLIYVQGEGVKYGRML